MMAIPDSHNDIPGNNPECRMLVLADSGPDRVVPGGDKADETYQNSMLLLSKSWLVPKW
jgi:hypothetical protein